MSPELAHWQATGRMVDLPNSTLRVFAMQYGDAEAAAADTALLLHGFPESSYSWHKVVDGLQQRFSRIVLLDMPGYGFSDKPSRGYSYSLIEQADVVLQVWLALGVSGGHVISHDMGTSVLTELLARQVAGYLPRYSNGGFDQRFQSVTFTNGSMVLRLAQLRAMQKLMLSPLGPSISRFASYSLFRRTVQSAHGVEAPATQALSESDIGHLWQSCMMQNGHQKNHLLISYLHDRKRFEQSRWLPALRLAAKTMPVHICWGDADRVAQVKMARYLKESICPEATLTEMPGVGHFCQLGSPDIWLSSILPFYRHEW